MQRAEQCRDICLSIFGTFSYVVQHITRTFLEKKKRRVIFIQSLAASLSVKPPPWLCFAACSINWRCVLWKRFWIVWGRETCRSKEAIEAFTTTVHVQNFCQCLRPVWANSMSNRVWKHTHTHTHIAFMPCLQGCEKLQDIKCFLFLMCWNEGTLPKRAFDNKNTLTSSWMIIGGKGGFFEKQNTHTLKENLWILNAKDSAVLSGSICVP